MLQLALLCLVQTPAAPQAARDTLPPHLEALFQASVEQAKRTVVFKLEDGFSVGVDRGRLASAQPEVAALAGQLEQFEVRRHLASDEEGVLGLLDLRRRALERGATDVADLTLYFEAYTRTPEEAEELAGWLQGRPGVEHAYLESIPVRPPNEDRDPPTPTWVDFQDYSEAGPIGTGSFDWAYYLGAQGDGIRIVDCEYSWAYNHEDLCLTQARIVSPDPVGTPGGGPFFDHGTAVLSIFYGLISGYGIDGSAPECDPYMSSQWTDQYNSGRRAIVEAAQSSSAGDVILIEIQTAHNDGEFLPEEWNQGSFDVVEQTTAAGIYVIAAAANGSTNLDDIKYGGAFDVNVRDSGAILVGGGSANALHTKLSFTNYGERVDCQSWGDLVYSAGYGDLFFPADPLQSYTSGFSGTSSASAIVSGTVLSLLGAMKAHGMTLPTPDDLRSALRTVGTPQDPTDALTGRIGPQPELGALFTHFGLPTGLSNASTAALNAMLTFDMTGNPDEPWTLYRALETEVRQTQAGVDVLGSQRFKTITTGQLDINGEASLTVTVPNKPGLVGRRAFVQALFDDGGFGRLSNGTAVRITN